VTLEARDVIQAFRAARMLGAGRQTGLHGAAIQSKETAMSGSHTSTRTRRGFSLIEMMIVLGIMGIVAAMALPKLNLNGSRVDAMAQQVRSVLLTSQRTSLTRQFDVIISIDTMRGGLRIAEDANNTGTIEPGEVRFWRPTGRAEGNVFAVPPRGFSTPTVTSSVVGSQLRSLDNLPSIVFHRDGSASSSAEIYVSNGAKGKPEYRCITLTRSTGRSDLYRLNGKALQWEVSR
jgi:prepilin-type N-terminal cleavage/methylation domain-containing protein